MVGTDRVTSATPIVQHPAWSNRGDAAPTCGPPRIGPAGSATLLPANRVCEQSIADELVYFRAVKTDLAGFAVGGCEFTRMEGDE